MCFLSKVLSQFIIDNTLDDSSHGVIFDISETYQLLIVIHDLLPLFKLIFSFASDMV